MPTDPAASLTRTLAAPRARVWDALVRPQSLARWLAPPGVSIAVIAADIRPGGTLHYAMDLPNGTRSWGRSLYREMEEPSRLAWANSFADAAGTPIRAPFFGDAFPLFMLNEITLDEEGEGTRLHLEWTPLDASPAEQRAAAASATAFRAGWGASLDGLARFLAAPN